MPDNRRDVLRRSYTREEEFLAEFEAGGIISAAVAALAPDEWHPNDACDDRTRQQQDYNRKAGTPAGLTFEGAAVYHTPDKVFSSVVIVVGDSHRTISVKVSEIDGQMIGERINETAR